MHSLQIASRALGVSPFEPRILAAGDALHPSMRYVFADVHLFGVAEQKWG